MPYQTAVENKSISNFHSHPFRGGFNLEVHEWFTTYVLAVFCFIFARSIILLVGGESYIDSVLSFRILLVSLLPIAASNIIGGQVLIPAGLEKRLLTAEITGALFNFIANLMVIPYLSIAGAAITTVVSELIVWILCVYYAKKDLDMDFFFGVIKKLISFVSKRLRVAVIKIYSRLKGDKLPCYCPCCNTHLNEFINGEFDKKPDLYNVDRYRGIDQKVICPVCGSLPRHRIIVSWLSSNLTEGSSGELSIEKTILHFAQERSLKIWLDKNHKEYITADLFNPADLKIDIEDTKLPDGSYDMIICNHVLEHVLDYKKALKELYRILSPNGRIIISFPVDTTLDTVYEDDSVTDKAGRIRHFGQADHLRVFGTDSTQMLRNVGFEVTEINGDIYDSTIKPVVGPADYDSNVLWYLTKKEEM